MMLESLVPRGKELGEFPGGLSVEWWTFSVEPSTGLHAEDIQSKISCPTEVNARV